MRRGGEGESAYDIGLSMVAHSQSTATIIVGQRALFREGVAAFLRRTPYKVIASAQRSSELKNVRASAGSRTLVILGIDEQYGNATPAAENVRAVGRCLAGPAGDCVSAADSFSNIRR